MRPQVIPTLATRQCNILYRQINNIRELWKQPKLSYILDKWDYVRFSQDWSGVR